MPPSSLKRIRWFAAIYAALIVLAVILADDGQYQFVFAWIRGIPGGDKVGHFCLMGGLSFVVNLALGLRHFTMGRWQFLLGSAIVGTLVLVEEISQAWFPSRTFDLVDLTFDFLGICFFGWLAKRSQNGACPSRAQQHP
jgi:polysaccharide biosynthesis protein VpsQ